MGLVRGAIGGERVGIWGRWMGVSIRFLGAGRFNIPTELYNRAPRGRSRVLPRVRRWRPDIAPKELPRQLFHGVRSREFYIGLRKFRGDESGKCICVTVLKR